MTAGISERREKMNDNDIIKALEHCASSKTSEACKGCPLLRDNGSCRDDGLLLYESALDVINHQKTEIEKLRKENTELKDGYFQKRNDEIEHQELMFLRKAWRKSNDQNMDLQLDNERLQAENKEQDQAIINALHRMGQIRAEAIKEFAERLCDGRVSNDPVVIAVKCAVKEMTEVRHAETD